MPFPSFFARGGWRTLAVLGLLGFSSGLPLALSGATLQARLTTEGVPLAELGWLTLIGLPYTLKFLWAPWFDRWRLPWLGRRRGWILLSQGLTALLIFYLGQLSGTAPHWLLGTVAVALALASATQDIVVDAYRTDVLPSAARGLGASVAALGYRLAMFCAGALALIWAAQQGWRFSYEVMALLMGVGMIATLVAREPDPVEAAQQDGLLAPWRDYWLRPAAASLLGLVILYKLGDALAFALSSAFLLRGLGFDLVQVAWINKGVGLGATLLGSFMGGALMMRWGLFASLWRMGWIQGLSTLAFVGLAAWGHHLSAMVAAVFLENFTSGMGTAAFAALLMALCNPRYSATQFALLSALAALGRVVIGPLAGWLAQWAGWEGYFLVATLLALPGLWLLKSLRQSIEALA